MVRPPEIAFSTTPGLFYHRPPELEANTRFYSSVPSVFAPWGIGLEASLDLSVKSDGYWSYISGLLPNPQHQGWKIHVSSTLYDAKNVLREVLRVALDFGVSFKFLANPSVLRASLTKYADRIQSGKFIVVYPQDDSQLNHLLSTLIQRLRCFDGPEILSDLKVGDAPVYVRYGAFELIFGPDDDGNLVPCIKDNNGNLVPDIRDARLEIPSWVKVPDFLNDALTLRQSQVLASPALRSLTFQKALHFSNSGGVFLCDTEAGDHVVVKEARPFVGYDANDASASDRLHNEWRVLKELSSVYGVVDARTLVNEYGHLFLIEEYLPGVTLSTWIAQNYPFSSSLDASSYIRRSLSIAARLKRIINEVHALGWTVGDLQPTNIVVGDEDSVHLIDLESAISVDGSGTGTIGTPGFAPDYDAAPVDRDWFAYNNIVANLFVPMVPLNCITEDLRKAQRAIAPSVVHPCLETSLPPVVPDGSCNRDPAVKSAYFTQPKTVHDFANGLRLGLLGSIDRKSIIESFPGDVLKYESTRELSVLHGVTGAVPWLPAGFLEDLLKETPRYAEAKPQSFGYLSGTDGARIVFEEYTDAHLAGTGLQFDRFLQNSKPDVSLRTGIGGVLLSAVAWFLRGTPPSDDVMRFLRAIPEQLDPAKCVFVSPHATSSAPKGFFDGALGFGFALWVCCQIFDDPTLKKLATEFIVIDIDNCVTASDGSTQILDGSRMMPYLSEGSAGFILAAGLIPELAEFTFNELDIDALVRATRVRTTASAGLLLGRSGLYLAEFIALSKGWVTGSFDYSAMLRDLSLHAFTSDNEEGLLMGGQGGLRLSCDFATGNAGVLWMLDQIVGTGSLWDLLPGLHGLASGQL